MTFVRFRMELWIKWFDLSLLFFRQCESACGPHNENKVLMVCDGSFQYHPVNLLIQKSSMTMLFVWHIVDVSYLSAGRRKIFMLAICRDGLSIGHTVQDSWHFFFLCASPAERIQRICGEESTNCDKSAGEAHCAKNSSLHQFSHFLRQFSPIMTINSGFSH